LGDKERVDSTMTQASDALLRRMAEVHTKLNAPPAEQQPAAPSAAPGATPGGAPGDPSPPGGTATPGAPGAAGAGAGAGADAANAAPATQPLEAVADYVMGDVQKLKDRGDEALYSAYVSALVRLAWYQIYFAEKLRALAS
jgi:hypothetical protein